MVVSVAGSCTKKKHIQKTACRTFRIEKFCSIYLIYILYINIYVALLHIFLTDLIVELPTLLFHHVPPMYQTYLPPPSRFVISPKT